MSLSDPLKTLPMIHHFYPINPDTALQQQSAVYNTPDHPLVTPILPTPSQPFPDAPPNNNKKRKVQEVDSEVQYLGSLPSGSLSQTREKLKHLQLETSQDPSKSLAICLGPRQRRRIPYVELPDNRSINLALYRPVSLALPASQVLLGWGRHHRPAGIVSQTSLDECAFSPPSPHQSTISEYLDPDDSIPIEGMQKKKAKRNTQAKDIGVLEDDATTCHQCRRKTTKEKMRCRRLRPDGSVCPYLFCQYCIEVRYDEIFNSFHPTWHCPRCRGTCNCSICLRKAGFGYILDGFMSEQFTGIQGRLSVAGHRHKRSKGVKNGDQRDEGKLRVSVRAWLARKGIALGTEEWMTERRRQGVRYVVGKSPPPPDVPSPYMQAQFNSTIAACTDYIEDIEDDDVNDPSDEKLLCEDDAENATSSGPLIPNHSEAIAVLPTQEMNSNCERLQPDVRPNSDALNDMPAAETRGEMAGEETGSHTVPLPLPDADASAFPSSSEDLPGLGSALTYSLRLIVGKSFPKPTRKKYQLKAPKIKKQKVNNLKKRVGVDVSDYGYVTTTQQKVGWPVIRARGCNPHDSGPQMVIPDDDKEEKDAMRGSSPVSDIFQSPLHAESTPPPAEPVLVPTEYYAPSKLDATIAKSSQAQYGHTYWSFNAVTPREHVHEHYNGHEHASSSSSLMSTPLYSNNDRHSYPQFSVGDVCPVGLSATESASASTRRHGLHSFSESTSLSNSHTPDDYLDSQVHAHVRDVETYTAHDLTDFTTLGETWTPVGLDAYPNLEIDISALQVEGIAPQTVDVALHKRTCDQP